MRRDKFRIYAILLSSYFIGCVPIALASDNNSAPAKIRVAIFLDRGAHPRLRLLTNLSTQPDMQVSAIFGEEIRQGALNNYDLLLVPGGSGKREARSLEPQGKEEIRKFVASGGLYIGICAGDYLAGRSRAIYLGLIPLSNVDREHWRRGRARLTIEFTPAGKEILGTDKQTATVIYHNGPVMNFKNPSMHPEIKPLAYFRDEVVAPEGIVGLMTGAPAMLFTRYGKGLVIGISPHPEATPGLGDLVPNAIRWLYRHRTNSSNDINTLEISH